MVAQPRRWHEYTPTYGVSMCAPAVPLSVIDVAYCESEDSFFDSTSPVVAIVAEIKGIYTKAMGEQEKYRQHEPSGLDNAKGLEEDGWTTDSGHRQVKTTMLYLCPETYELVDVHEYLKSASNVAFMVVETSRLAGERWNLVDELKAIAKDKVLKSRQASKPTTT